MAAMTDPIIDERRTALLDAAVGVFLRYGYKKTSMDDVAKAGGLSRQGLYLHFASKEILFAAGLLHVQEQALAAARAALLDEQLPLIERLVGGFSALHALHFTHNTTLDNMAEIAQAIPKDVAAIVATRQARFAVDVIKVLRTAGLAAAGRKPTIKEIAFTLEAAAVGIKHRAPSLASYREQMRTVCSVCCGGRS